jgi:hypothetical protein
MAKVKCFKCGNAKTMSISTTIRATAKSAFTLSLSETKSHVCDSCAPDVLRALSDEMQSIASTLEGGKDPDKCEDYGR